MIEVIAHQRVRGLRPGETGLLPDSPAVRGLIANGRLSVIDPDVGDIIEDEDERRAGPPIRPGAPWRIEPKPEASPTPNESKAKAAGKSTKTDSKSKPESSGDDA